MRKPLLLLLPLVLASVLLAVGCGDDDDSSASSGADATSSPTKAEYVKEARALCSSRRQKLTGEIAAFVRSYGKRYPQKRAAKETFAAGTRAVGLPAIQDVIDGLRELGAPAGDEEQIEGMLSSMQRAVKKLEKRTPSESNLFQQEFEASGDTAREYGIGICAFG